MHNDVSQTKDVLVSLYVADDHAKQKYGKGKKNSRNLAAAILIRMEILSDANNGMVYKIVQRY